MEIGSEVFKINDQFEKEAINAGKFELKEGFSLEIKNGKIVSVKQLFMDAKLKDGTTIRIEGDTPEKGAKVTVITEDGEVPAPDGAHELEDGSEIHTEGGEISQIESAGEEAGDDEDEETEGQYDETGEKVRKVTKKLKDNPDVDPHPNPKEVDKDAEPGGHDVLHPEHKEIMDMLHDLVGKVKDKMEQMDSEMTDMKNQFAAFAKQPAGKKIPNGKTDLTINSFSSEDDKIKAILELRKSNK